MTPDNIKAKSDELIQKFRNELSWIEVDYNVDLWRDARQCAIIAVEEILKIAPAADVFNPWREEEASFVDYWNEVLNYLKSKL